MLCFQSNSYLYFIFSYCSVMCQDGLIYSWTCLQEFGTSQEGFSDFCLTYLEVDVFEDFVSFELKQE